VRPARSVRPSSQQQLAPRPSLLTRSPFGPAAPSPSASITAVRFDLAVESGFRAPYKPSTPMETLNFFFSSPDPSLAAPPAASGLRAMALP
jgi:hypothetical protein